MLRKRLQSYRIKQFTGGRNSVASDYDLDPSYSADDLNVDLKKPGSIRKRAGYRRFVDVELGVDPITGLYRYYNKAGSRYLLALCGSVLWQGEGDSPMQMHQISTAFTSGSFMTFATMQDWCYMANYEDDTMRWNGTSHLVAGLACLGGAVLDTAQNCTWSATGGYITEGDTSSDYTYAFTAVHGSLGESNAIPRAVNGTVSPSSGAGKMDFALDTTTNDSYTLVVPSGVTGINVYRTLQNGTSSEPNIPTIYYYVGKMSESGGVWSFTDDKSDAALLSEYEGDRLPPPRCRFMAEHNNRMWFAYTQTVNEYPDPYTASISGITDDDGTYPSRIVYSDLYQPDRRAGFIDVFPEDGDAITGIASLHNNLVVFKNNKTYLILGFSEADFEVRLVNGSVGCVAPRTITIVDNLVYFLAADGVWTFDGAGFQRESDLIREDIITLPQVGRNYAAGGSWKGRYYLSVKEDE